MVSFQRTPLANGDPQQSITQRVSPPPRFPRAEPTLIRVFDDLPFATYTKTTYPPFAHRILILFSPFISFIPAAGAIGCGLLSRAGHYKEKLIYRPIWKPLGIYDISLVPHGTLYPQHSTLDRLFQSGDLHLAIQYSIPAASSPGAPYFRILNHPFSTVTDSHTAYAGWAFFLLSFSMCMIVLTTCRPVDRRTDERLNVHEPSDTDGDQRCIRVGISRSNDPAFSPALTLTSHLASLTLPTILRLVLRNVQA